jgi:hypothetical protein
LVSVMWLILEVLFEALGLIRFDYIGSDGVCKFAGRAYRA